jgi:hypothetical protein
MSMIADSIVPFMIQTYDDLKIEIVSNTKEHTQKMKILQGRDLLLIIKEGHDLFSLNVYRNEIKSENEYKGNLSNIKDMILQTARRYLTALDHIGQSRISEFHDMLCTHNSVITRVLASEKRLSDDSNPSVILSYKTWAFTCYIDFDSVEKKFIANWQDGSLNPEDHGQYHDIKTVQTRSAHALLDSILLDARNYGLLQYLKERGSD